MYNHWRSRISGSYQQLLLTESNSPGSMVSKSLTVRRCNSRDRLLRLASYALRIMPVARVVEGGSRGYFGCYGRFLTCQSSWSDIPQLELHALVIKEFALLYHPFTEHRSTRFSASNIRADSMEWPMNLKTTGKVQ